MKTESKITENISVLKFFARYNDRNVDEMMKLFSDDAQVIFLPLGEAGAGSVHELGKAIWTQLIVSFPDIENHMTKSKVDEEKSQICEVNIKGTQVTDFFDISNKGKAFESDHIFIFKFNDQDQIREVSINWDHNHFQRQLGN